MSCLVYLPLLPAAACDLTGTVSGALGTAAVQVIGSVFLLAGINKFYARKRFSNYLSENNLMHAFTARATSRLIPEAEVAIGLALIGGGRYVQGVLIACIALLVGFTIFQVRIWVAGKKLPCPCGFRFGEIGGTSVVRNLLLIAISILAMNCLSAGDLTTGADCAVRVATSLLVLYYASNGSRTGHPAS